MPACRIPQWLRKGGLLARSDKELILIQPIFVFEESARRRTGRPFAILVICATMTGTQEEPRLRKPAHRTPQVRAIDGEYLEFVRRDPSNPARCLGRIPIPGAGERIPIGGKTRFSGGKPVETPQGHPR